MAVSKTDIENAYKIVNDAETKAAEQLIAKLEAFQAEIAQFFNDQPQGNGYSVLLQQVNQLNSMTYPISTTIQNLKTTYKLGEDTTSVAP